MSNESTETPPQPDPRSVPWELLKTIASDPERAWFASVWAKAENTDRDSLDEPLLALRIAKLIEVVDWQKGIGQGLRISELGQQALADREAFAKYFQADPIGEPTDEADDEDPGTTTTLTQGDQVRGAIYTPKPARIVPLILSVNFLLFMLGAGISWSQTGSMMPYLRGNSIPVFSQIGAVQPSQVLNGEYWRLLTCSFVHIGILHLFFNMLMLFILGPLAENMWGHWRFGFIYLGSGLAASIFAISINPMPTTDDRTGEILLAGASGSLWGMLIAIIFWLIRYREHIPATQWQPSLQQLIWASFFNIGLSFLPNISWEAHLGGGVAGFALAYGLDAVRKRERGSIVRGVGVLLLTILFFGGIYVSCYSWSTDWKTLRARVNQTLQVSSADVNALNQQLNELLVGLQYQEIEKLHKPAAMELIVLKAFQNANYFEVLKEKLQMCQQGLQILQKPRNESARLFRDYFQLAEVYLKFLIQTLPKPEAASAQKNREYLDELKTRWNNASEALEKTQQKIGS